MKWFEMIQRNRYNFLFIVMLLCFFIIPATLEAAHISKNLSSQWMLLLASSLFMALASFAVGSTRKTLLVCLVFMLISIVMETWMILTTSTLAVAVVHHILRVLFFSFVILQIFKGIFRPSVVTLDTISSSLCGYLLIGVLWANIYSIVELAMPESISMLQHRSATKAGSVTELTMSFRMLYFSFVTISTVGYGDVVPLSSVSRMLAMCEAIIGQLYLLVMVSRLVGIHISQPVAAEAAKSNDSL